MNINIWPNQLFYGYDIQKNGITIMEWRVSLTSNHFNEWTLILLQKKIYIQICLQIKNVWAAIFTCMEMIVCKINHVVQCGWKMYQSNPLCMEPAFIARDSEVIMLSPCVFVCLSVCLSVYVCHDVCPGDLTMKDWCRTNHILQLYCWGCLVLQVMFHALMTSLMTLLGHKVGQILNWYISVNILVRASIKSSKYRQS